MAKVTSKLQLTVPKAIADRYGIRPGDELDWIAAGESIRVSLAKPSAGKRHSRTPEERLRLFDQATERQRQRDRNPQRAQRARKLRKPQERERGWSREDLYTRGRAR